MLWGMDQHADLTRWHARINRQASITSSKPLFMRVAESTVIRLPIFQVGWFRACSTVMLAKSAPVGVFEEQDPPECRGARTRQHFIAPAPAHALMHRIVLAVDGQQWLILATSLGSNQIARCDKALFVGQTDGFPPKTPWTASCRWLPVQRHPRWRSLRNRRRDGAGDLHGSSRAVDDFNSIAQAGLPKTIGKLVCSLGGPHRENLRAPAPCLLEGEFDIAAGRYGYDGEAVRKSFNDVEGALADGASGNRGWQYVS